MNNMPIKRRARITHRPRIEVKDPTKTIKWLVTDKIITLIIVSAPCVYVMFMGQAMLAEYNAKVNASFKNYEYQLHTWQRLERQLVEDAEAYYRTVADTINDMEYNYTDWNLPKTTAYDKLRNTLDRIRMYGE